MARKSKDRTIEELNGIIAETRAEIIELDNATSAKMVAPEVEANGLQARLWRAESMLRLLNGDAHAAQQAAVLACKFSEQQAKSARATTADRLAALEKQADERRESAEGLRLIS